MKPALVFVLAMALWAMGCSSPLRLNRQYRLAEFDRAGDDGGERSIGVRRCPAGPEAQRVPLVTGSNQRVLTPLPLAGTAAARLAFRVDPDRGRRLYRLDAATRTRGRLGLAFYIFIFGGDSAAAGTRRLNEQTEGNGPDQNELVRPWKHDYGDGITPRATRQLEEVRAESSLAGAPGPASVAGGGGSFSWADSRV